MTAPIPGTCLCGRVRFELTLPTRFVCHCHCENCRRAHGAAFVTWAGVPSEQLALLGDASTLVRYPTETGATRSFCGACGTTLFYESPRWAGEIHIAIAHLDGELDRAPSGHVYADRAPRWAPITDGLPRAGGPTGVEPLDDAT